MAKSTALNVTQNVANPCVTILPADATAFKTVHTAGVNDDIVKSLMIASTDTAAMNVQLAINTGAADFILGTVNVPIASGTNGTAASVDALASSMLPGLPLDQSGKRVLPLKAGYVLKARVLVAVTAAKQVDISSVVEQY